ncbi:MAG: sel1 repeat family protein [Rhodanobacteraceae bacterium]
MPLPMYALCALPLCGAGPALAQVDAVGPGGSSLSTTYGSSVDDRPSGFSGPEDNARPGESFFHRGVEAFRDQQYAFAIEMYQVAASWAYKPAEYNLGVIYAKGQGVPADLPRAMAWMTLAAERGSRRYKHAREAVRQSLTSDQLAQAEAIKRELEPKFGDAVALARAKNRWRETRAAATGSHLGFVGNLQVGANDPVGSSQKTPDQGAGSIGSVATTASNLTGGKQIDGSVAYRRLRETDNPYDPRFAPVTGTATVGPISADESDADKAAKPAKPAKKDDDGSDSASHE